MASTLHARQRLDPARAVTELEHLLMQAKNPEVVEVARTTSDGRPR